MSKNAISNFTEIKAALIRVGSNLAAWSRDHGYPVTTVYQAASGTRSGKKSLKIRAKLLKELTK